MISLNYIPQLLAEAIVHGDKPRNHYYIVYDNGHLWSWDDNGNFTGSEKDAEELFKRVKNVDDVKEMVENGIDDWETFQGITFKVGGGDSVPEIIVAFIHGDTIDLLSYGKYQDIDRLKELFGRNNVHLTKLMKFLNLKTISYGDGGDYDEYDNYVPETEERIGNDLDKAIKDRASDIFYHGTEYKSFTEIARLGLMPQPLKTNFAGLKFNHQNHVFLADNVGKAMFYAVHSSINSGTYCPIILHVKIPDPAKLDFDYDAIGDTIDYDVAAAYFKGEVEKLEDGVGYDNVEELRKTLKKIAKYAGVSYAGRIPPKFISKVTYSPDLLFDMFLAARYESETGELTGSGTYHESFESGDVSTAELINIFKRTEYTESIQEFRTTVVETIKKVEIEIERLLGFDEEEE